MHTIIYLLLAHRCKKQSDAKKNCCFCLAQMASGRVSSLPILGRNRGRRFSQMGTEGYSQDRVYKQSAYLNLFNCDDCSFCVAFWDVRGGGAIAILISAWQPVEDSQDPTRDLWVMKYFFHFFCNLHKFSLHKASTSSICNSKHSGCTHTHRESSLVCGTRQALHLWNLKILHKSRKCAKFASSLRDEGGNLYNKEKTIFVLSTALQG